MKQAAVCTKKLWLVASIGGLQLLGGKSDSLGGGGGFPCTHPPVVIPLCLFIILVPNLTAKLVLHPKDNPPLLGGDYKLECKLTPGPYAYSSKFKFTYEWFNLSNSLKEKESSISFQPFKLLHVGKYYCKVTLSCEGKIVDEKETDELDMALIGMITLLVHISYLVMSFPIHKYALLTISDQVYFSRPTPLNYVLWL